MEEIKIGKWHSLSNILSNMPECHYNKLAKDICSAILMIDGCNLNDILRISGIVIMNNRYHLATEQKNRHGNLVDIHYPIYRVYVFITYVLYHKIFSYTFGEQK